MKLFYVYILKCVDDSYYTGETDDLEKRVWDHSSGNGSVYTAQRLPVVLVYAEAFTTRIEAFFVERQIKGWSRKKKEALMRNDWQEILRLSNLKNSYKKQ